MAHCYILPDNLYSGIVSTNDKLFEILSEMDSGEVLNDVWALVMHVCAASFGEVVHICEFA